MGYSLSQLTPSWELVADYAVSGSAITSYTFNNLNITKDDDYMLVANVNNTTASAVGYYLFANGYTSPSSYYVQLLQADGTSIYPARWNENACGQAQNGKSSLMIVPIKLTNSGHFVFQSSLSRNYGGSGIVAEKWYNTSTFTASSITNLVFSSSATNGIGIGSRFQLYKCVADKVADVTISGSAVTSVDFSNLSIDKGSEFMLVSDIYNSSSSGQYYSLFPNDNLTTTNYYVEELTASGTGISCDRYNTNAFSGQGNQGKSISITNIKLTNNGYFAYQSYTNREYSSSIVLELDYSSSTFTMSSIQKLTAKSNVANGIGIGSRFQLYKMR